MKQTLLVFCLIIFSVKLFGQQFSQYNTGTLYDSFENPSQRAFLPDTSKTYAFNFFIPNFNADVFLAGNAQSSLKSRLFLNNYDNTNLKIGQGKFNRAYVNANVYSIMFKMFTSVRGDAEMGLSAETRVEGRGTFSDETIAALNGTQSFSDGTYNNIFNDHYYYQAYNQISYSYREQITKQFAFGLKVSALLGIQYQKLDINQSQVTYDKDADTANVALKGRYYNSYEPGHIDSRDLLPTFRNPGASMSLGGALRTEDGFLWQANIKDLGFIHWDSSSQTYNFEGSQGIYGLSTTNREDSIYNKVYKILRSQGSQLGSFTTVTNGHAELSVNKLFFLDDDKLFRYAPTLIASKELFYTGFVAALVNPFQYKRYVVTVTTTYDDLKTFNLGLQFMMKTPNFEFYLGSDRLTQTASFASEGISKNQASIEKPSPLTAANFFLGFSYKFGPVIEHDLNSSSIPMGEKGFFGRLFGRIFKTNE